MTYQRAVLTYRTPTSLTILCTTLLDSPLNENYHAEQLILPLVLCNADYVVGHVQSSGHPTSLVTKVVVNIACAANDIRIGH